ncbi:MAG: hypothetical protein ACOX75_04155 [Lachnospiraceae bacterium]
MKRLISIFLIFLVLTAAGCDNKNTNEESSELAASETLLPSETAETATEVESQSKAEPTTETESTTKA